MWPECENDKLNACCKAERPEPIIPKLVRDISSELSEIHGLACALGEDVNHIRGEREERPHECDCLVEGLETDFAKAVEIKKLMQCILGLFRSDV